MDDVSHRVPRIRGGLLLNCACGTTPRVLTLFGLAAPRKLRRGVVRLAPEEFTATYVLRGSNAVRSASPRKFRLKRVSAITVAGAIKRIGWTDMASAPSRAKTPHDGVGA